MQDDIVFSAKKRKQELRSKGAYHSKRELALMVKERLETLAGGEKIDNVMDICCGSGNLLKVFDDDVEKVGVDIELEFIQYCNDNIKGNFLCSNALALSRHNLPRNRGSKYIVGNYPFGLRDKKIACALCDIVKADREFPYCNELRDMPELPSLLDCAFIAKNLQCLERGGKAVIVTSLGVLYRGAKEQKFREWLVKKGWLKSIEQIKGDFFDDTTITIGILCFDMSKESRDIEMIEGERRAIATYAEIEKNHFALTPTRYLPSPEIQSDTEPFDIEESLEETNSYQIKGLEITLKMNQACELLESIVGEDRKKLISGNCTPNEKLIRALESKLKEWKKIYLPKREKCDNAPSLFD